MMAGPENSDFPAANANNPAVLNAKGDNAKTIGSQPRSPGFESRGDSRKTDDLIALLAAGPTRSESIETEDLAPSPIAGQRGHRRRLAVNALGGGIANVLKVGVQLVMLPVMTHLLGPAEFGLYSLALPTVNFFLTLADGGLGISLARESERSTNVWSTAFWILMASGLGLGLVVAGWGIVLSEVAHEPRLQGIMAFLSISFFMITCSVLPTARLTRRNNLVFPAIVDLASTIIGAAVAIFLALRGAGAWSLAVQYVVGLAVRAVALNTAAFAIPTFAFKPELLRPHVSIGSAVLGSRLVEFGGRLVENLLFSRALGAAALGNYTFANQAPRFIFEAGSNPLWGALYAHALKDDRRSVAVIHEKLVRLLAIVVFPVACLLSASASDVLDLLLGAKWAVSASMLAVLVPGYALNAVASQSGAILMASDHGRELFWSYFGLTMGRLAAVGIGLTLGSVSVAWGVTAANILFSLYMFGAPARTIGAGIKPMLQGLVTPALSALAAGLVCFAVLASHGPTPLRTAAGLASGLVVYVAVLLLIDGSRLRREIVALRRAVLRSSGAA